MAQALWVEQKHIGRGTRRKAGLERSVNIIGHNLELHGDVGKKSIEAIDTIKIQLLLGLVAGHQQRQCRAILDSQLFHIATGTCRCTQDLGACSDGEWPCGWDVYVGRVCWVEGCSVVAAARDECSSNKQRETDSANKADSLLFMGYPLFH